VDVAKDVEDAVFAIVGTFGILAILVALVNLSKERIAYAVVGLFILPVGIVIAFRLARPHSLWARLFYRDRKKALAEERFGGSHLHRPHKPQAAPDQSAAGSG
jgi:hypothetical protein